MWAKAGAVGNPAGSRSASSTNPQPGPAPEAPDPLPPLHNKGAMVRERIGSIRTDIQEQGGGAVAAAGERAAGGGGALSWGGRGYAGALAQ